MLMCVMHTCNFEISFKYILPYILMNITGEGCQSIVVGPL